MEKYSLFGELLYLGFVCEKGRCKSSGFWKLGYKRILHKHIVLLSKLIQCILVSEVSDNDALILKKFIESIQTEKDIIKYYPINEDTMKKLQDSNYSIITSIDSDRCNNNINLLMNDITTEILELLDHKFFLNKKRIAMLIRAIHNLPRVYLGKGLHTLCNIEQPAIDYKAALEYSFNNMDEDTRQRYRKYYQ